MRRSCSSSGWSAFRDAGASPCLGLRRAQVHRRPRHLDPAGRSAAALRGQSGHRRRALDRSGSLARKLRVDRGSASLSRLRLGRIRAISVCGLPRNLEEAIKKFGKATVDRNGTLPWRTEEMYGKLKDAFAAYPRADRLRASTSCSTRRGWVTTSAMRTCRCMPSLIPTVRRPAARDPYPLRGADVRALRETTEAVTETHTAHSQPARLHLRCAAPGHATRSGHSRSRSCGNRFARRLRQRLLRRVLQGQSRRAGAAPGRIDRRSGRDDHRGVGSRRETVSARARADADQRRRKS